MPGRTRIAGQDVAVLGAADVLDAGEGVDTAETVLCGAGADGA